MKPTPKTSLLAVLSLFLALRLAAQVFPPDDVSRQFGSPAEHDISRKIISAADGHFLVAGEAGASSFIMKLTSCGDTLWLKTWLFGTKTVFNDIGELPGGQLVAAGYCENCADDVNDTADKMLLVKTDASGETIQDAKLGMENRDAYGIALAIAPDSSVVVAGHTLVGGIAGNQVHLYRISSQDFSVQWQSFFAQLFLDYAGGLEMTAGGTFLITGWSLDFGGPEHFTAYHVMADGMMIWENRWNLNGLTTGVIHRATAAKQLPNQDFVVLGRVYMDTMRNEEVLMAKIDLISGDTLAVKTFGSAGNDKGNDLHLVNGDEFLVAWDEGAGFTANLSRLDANFEEIETKTWDHSILAYYIPSVVPLSDDGEDYALVRNQIVFSGQWDFFFIKHATAGHLAQLTEMPQSFQLYPRDTSTNMAATHVVGKVGLASGYDSMALWVYREGELLDTLNHPLNYIGDSASFAFGYEIPAELAEYAYKLWGVAGGRKHFEAEACGVVAGDAYLIYGQSNAVAGFSNFDRDVYIRNFGLRNFGADTLYAWHKRLDEYNPNPFIDKQPGNWGQRMAANIIEQYQVPVAIINGAVGGQIIENLAADPADHFNPGTIYGRWLDRADKAELRDHVRAILFFQGESNAGAFICDSTHVYKGKFQIMHTDWQADFPGFERGYLFQIEACLEFGFGPFCSLRIQEAQRQLADEIEGLDIMSASAMRQGADSCHYVYPNGHERAGNDIFRLVAHDLYGSQITDNIYPPNIDTAYFSAYDSLAIVIEVRDNEQTLSWHPGLETDFWLEGTVNDSVASGEIIDNKIVLHLDAPPAPGFTGLSYASHYGSGETPVTNANGIGLLHFKNFPVAGARLLAHPVVFLQGAYDSTSGLMRDNLRANGNLPLTEPYTALGYTLLGGGGESTVQEVIDISGANAIVDWVFLELRDPTDLSIVLATRSALLQRDGDVADVDGLSPVAFYGLPEGEYYLAVKHRNHLGVMSALPVSLSAAVTVVDLTADTNNAYGGINGIAPLGDGQFGLYSGDFNRNGQVQNTDYAAMVQTLGTAGYVPGDLDLNGQVQNTDLQLELVPNIGRGQAFGQ